VSKTIFIVILFFIQFKIVLFYFQTEIKESSLLIELDRLENESFLFWEKTRKACKHNDRAAESLREISKLQAVFLEKTSALLVDLDDRLIAPSPHIEFVGTPMAYVSQNPLLDGVGLVRKTSSPALPIISSPRYARNDKSHVLGLDDEDDLKTLRRRRVILDRLDCNDDNASLEAICDMSEFDDSNSRPSWSLAGAEKAAFANERHVFSESNLKSLQLRLKSNIEESTSYAPSIQHHRAKPKRKKALSELFWI